MSYMTAAVMWMPFRYESMGPWGLGFGSKHAINVFMRHIVRENILQKSKP